MAIKIAPMNQKGGVGKSSLVYILADLLRRYGKVLVLDLDQQNNQKTILGVRSKVNRENTSAGVLMKGYSPLASITNVCENVDLLPSGGKTIESFNTIFRTQDDNEIILKRKMQEVEKEYDFILIDSNPSMNLIHANIACYADYILLPCDMELMSFSAVRSMIHFFQSFEEKSKHKVASILGVIPLRYDKRRRVDDMVKDDLESLEENDLLNGGIIFRTLRESANLKTAQTKRKFLSDVFPNGKLTHDCLDLAQELIQRIQEVRKKNKPNQSQTTTSDTVYHEEEFQSKEV